MRFIKVIFLGASRLGKTTVHRRLTREIVDISTAGETQPQPSTGVVESGGNVFIRNFTSNTALAKPFEWVLVDRFFNLFTIVLVGVGRKDRYPVLITGNLAHGPYPHLNMTMCMLLKKMTLKWILYQSFTMLGFQLLLVYQYSMESRFVHPDHNVAVVIKEG